jgi:hypothetical protein
VTRETIFLKNDSDVTTSVVINGTEYTLHADDEIEVPLGVAMT